VSTAYLGLGSNLGDRAGNLLRAAALLINSGVHITGASSIYETDPVDVPEERIDQPRFLNMVIRVEAPHFEPFSLLAKCLATEQQLGRERVIYRGPRTIDIDLLIIDDLVVNGVRGDMRLDLPHQRMHLRRFVLLPLAEIAPELKHPVAGISVRDLLMNLTGGKDTEDVRIYAP